MPSAAQVRPDFRACNLRAMRDRTRLTSALVLQDQGRPVAEGAERVVKDHLEDFVDRTTTS